MLLVWNHATKMTKDVCLKILENDAVLIGCPIIEEGFVYRQDNDANHCIGGFKTTILHIVPGTVFNKTKVP